MKKESVDLRSLKRNGAVTFTNENSQLKQLLADCEEKGIKVRIERYPYFISVMLKNPIQQRKRQS